MNTLKRTLALVATLAMSATAFVSCGSDDSSSSKAATTGAASTEAGSDAASTEAGSDAASTEAGSDASEAATSAAPSGQGNSTELGEVTLGKGGDKFSIVAWNEDDVPFLIDLWAQNGGDKGKVKFTSFGVGGGDASEKYDALFQSGKDLDVYFCEADWALKYINDDTKTAALEDLGFSEDNFSDVYSYTTEIGRATEGANKGKMVGASWQAAAGGFAYRTDLAEQYLGVKTPEEMQKKINNWCVLGMAVVATAVALKPTDLTQYMINFAVGAIASAWYFPVMLGMYWKKCTSKGMFASTVGGFVIYIICYFLSSVIPSTKAWWAANLGGVNSFVPAVLCSLILLVCVSLATQKDKVKLGYFQVFFCEDYDEKYAKLN